MTASSSFDAFNYSELYQACRHAGIKALPNEPRENLIAYLESEAEPDPQNVHEFDRWRDGIMRFLLDHWAVVAPQLTCPAKDGDPRACYKCVDAQVMCCVVQNQTNEHLIRIRRSKGDMT